MLSSKVWIHDSGEEDCDDDPSKYVDVKYKVGSAEHVQRWDYKQPTEIKKDARPGSKFKPAIKKEKSGHQLAVQDAAGKSPA